MKWIFLPKEKPTAQRSPSSAIADTYTSSKKNEHFETGGFLFDIFIAHSTNSCGHFDASSAILVGISLSRTVALRWWHHVVSYKGESMSLVNFTDIVRVRVQLTLLSTQQRLHTSSPTRSMPTLLERALDPAQQRNEQLRSHQGSRCI